MKPITKLMSSLLVLSLFAVDNAKDLNQNTVSEQSDINVEQLQQARNALHQAQKTKLGAIKAKSPKPDASVDNAAPVSKMKGSKQDGRLTSKSYIHPFKREVAEPAQHRFDDNSTEYRVPKPDKDQFIFQEKTSVSQSSTSQ